ncbi:MAG: swr1 complex component [Bathelium mastoideum]|nr:MAG: swr1 complex component [Bathelium mastoideum]
MNGGDRPSGNSPNDADTPTPPPSAAQDEYATNHLTNGDSLDAVFANSDHQNGYVEDVDQPDVPTLQPRKRKLVESDRRQRSASRATSPPWKKIAAEGPSSFVEDGRRKSSRVNVLPIDLQPQGEKRQTRAAQQQSIAKNLEHRQRLGSRQNGQSNKAARAASARHPLSAGTTSANVTTPAKRVPSQADTKRNHTESISPIRVRSDGQEDRRFKRVKVERPSSPTPTPRRSVGRPPKHRPQSSSYDSRAPAAPASTTTAPSASPQIYKLRFKIRTPTVPVLHPGGMPPRKKYDKFEDWLKSISKTGNDPEDAWMGDEKATEKWVKKEAKSRLDIFEAAKPGGLLSQEKCSVYVPEAQEEPPREHSHFDYVIAHAVNFQRLLSREQREHRTIAKKLAYAAAAAWKAKQPKTDEEVAKEQMAITQLIHKQLMRDIQQKWMMVAAEINRQRRSRWEEEQQRLANQNLDQILDHSTRLLDHRRLRQSSEISEEDMIDSAVDELSNDDEMDVDDSEEASGRRRIENPYSPTGRDQNKRNAYQINNSFKNIDGDEEEDDHLSAEQLRQKYAMLLESSKSQRQSAEAAIETSEHETQDDPETSDNGEHDFSENNAEESEEDSDDEGLDVGIEGMLGGPSDHDPHLDVKTQGSVLGEVNGSEDSEQNGIYQPQLLIDNIDTGEDPGTMHANGKISAHTTGQVEQEYKDVELEEVDETMLDDSDDSTDMDDEEDTSSDDDDDDDDGRDSEGSGDSSKDDDEDEDSGANMGLLGFLSKKEINTAKSQAVQEPVEDQARTSRFNNEEDGPGEEAHKIEGLPNGVNHDVNHDVHHNVVMDDIQQVDMGSADATSPASPSTSATAKPSEIDSASSVVPSTESKRQSPEPPKKALTKPSPLLRGTLREYQHEGLDWLAKLYADRTNGILADEMGLGKTIQAISLLAHLATERHVWGPHLVVVPTSVLLNWEVEFKKFLPGFKVLVYYGTADERRLKRKGWTDQDLFNVVITSYQIVVKDYQTFRIRNWHYMILDEAHNIKNFNSQKWQTLLKFKTQARLLLTGTPLQNNLTELWSLLWFITPGGAGMSTLDEFSRNFKLPAEQIFDKGLSVLDSRAKEVIGKLHHMLRPYLLRRLKCEVEKQMPAKYEHVVYCRLSKRQRQLYDGFMSRADTKQTLASGNYMSIINCLMSLRKVCNHPDLFETRQIVTSFAMDKSAVASYEIKELMVRKRLLDENSFERVDLHLFGNETSSKIDAFRTQYLSAARALQDLVVQQSKRLTSSQSSDGSTAEAALTHLDAVARKSRLQHLQNCARTTYNRIKRIPVYGTDMVEIFTFRPSSSPNRFAASRSGRFHAPGRLGISSFRFHGSGPFKAAEIAKASRYKVRPEPKVPLNEQYLSSCQALEDLTPSLARRAQEMEVAIQKFGCVTPSVVASDLLEVALTPRGVGAAQSLRANEEPDPFHEARIRLSIAFPDKRLLQYDCGKLQQLDKLLRQLQAGGHRALIFTQMTRVLDILEQFLNIHGHRYLRLDGSTHIELRQALTERFNSDERIPVFILSSRSGGLGINLTGADTVIFYDLDWNPAMDKQCQDRCHRIGQTRDVHIYRFVSEYTIEANILRKSNQKRLLDNVVIQEGEFNTDYFNKLSYRDALDDGPTAVGEDDEAGAAMDKVFGGGEATVDQVLESVEDQEDVQAAQNARKEEVQTDVADFEESGPGTQVKSTPKSSVPPMPGDTIPQAEANKEREEHADEHELPHVDNYMLRFVEWELSDVPVAPPIDKAKKKGKDYKTKPRR